MDISLKVTGSELFIKVADNGKGFDINNIKSSGNGLRNMKQRIEAVGGSYTITSVVGKGTITSVSVLLNKLSA